MKKAPSEFALCLAEILKKYHITQRRLAAYLGHKDATLVNKYKTGAVTPNAETCRRIVDSLALEKVSAEDLDRLSNAAKLLRKSPIGDRRIHRSILELNELLNNQLGPDDRQALLEDLEGLHELYRRMNGVHEAEQRRQWTEAVERVQAVRDSAENSAQKTYQRIFYAQGCLLHKAGRLTEALSWFNRARWIAEKRNDYPGLPSVLVKSGDSMRRKGGSEWRSAQEAYWSALRLYAQHKAENEYADCIRRLAGVYLFQRRPHFAEPLLIESLKLSQAQNDAQGQYKNWHHLAWSHELFGRYNDAIESCNRALFILERAQRDGEISDRNATWDRLKVLRYKADALRGAGQAVESENTYTAALDLFHQTDARDNEGRNAATIRLGRGKLYLQLGRLPKAEDDFVQGLKIHGGVGEDFRAIEFSVAQGQLLVAQARWQEAEELLQLAAVRYKQLALPVHYVEALAVLSELYYRQSTSVRQGNANEAPMLLRAADDARKWRQLRVDDWLPDDLDDDHLHQLVELIKSAARIGDASLISRHLAFVEMWFARHHVARSDLIAAAQAYSAALDRAMQFNSSIMDLVLDNLVEAIHHLATNGAPHDAVRFARGTEQAWVAMPQLKQYGSEVQRVVDRVQQTRREITTRWRLPREGG